MANKRMFSLSIVDTDIFLDLPVTSQNLYFHLSMRADDDGFISSPKKIMRIIGASKNDMDILLTKEFVIPFESGVCVIKHWKIHNYIAKDRYTETIYTDEKSQLKVEKNKVYTKCIQKCIQDDSTDKSSIDKSSIDKDIKHIYGEFKHVRLTDEDITKLDNLTSNTKLWITKLDEYIENTGKRYKNHYLTIRKWYNGQQDKKPKEKTPAEMAEETRKKLEGV